MSAYYFDASALAKRYTQERGSDWVIALMIGQAGVTYHSSVVIGVEVASALVRKANIGTISAEELQHGIVQFRLEWQLILETTDVSLAVVERAMLLTERHGLRGYDAVHLATALTVSNERHHAGMSPLVFVSADRTQLDAARAEGLIGENPNDHP